MSNIRNFLKFCVNLRQIFIFLGKFSYYKVNFGIEAGQVGIEAGQLPPSYAPEKDRLKQNFVTFVVKCGKYPFIPVKF